MKRIIQIMFLIQPAITGCAMSLQSDTTREKSEFFTSGFIDIINSGQINASARLLRVLIGEPGRFSIPVSIYSGVSSNSFQNQQTAIGSRSNEHLAAGFINPLLGLINISIQGTSGRNKRKYHLTRSGILYQGGFRILTGYQSGSLTDPQTGRPINFLNSFASGGFYFQTGAWDRNNEKNLGVFWGAMRYIASYSSPEQLQFVLGYQPQSGANHGWSIGWGIEINRVVNIKMVYYKYVRTIDPDFDLPIYQFCFNYAISNNTKTQ